MVLWRFFGFTFKRKLLILFIFNEKKFFSKIMSTNEIFFDKM